MRSPRGNVKSRASIHVYVPRNGRAAYSVGRRITSIHIFFLADTFSRIIARASFIYCPVEIYHIILARIITVCIANHIIK